MRITILQEAIVLLNNKKLGELAWAILDSAVESPNAEVLTAILGKPYLSSFYGVNK